MVKKSTKKTVVKKVASKKKSTTEMIGSWAFIIGILLAIIAGALYKLFDLGAVGTTIFVVLGIIVGLLNITHEESLTFLWASVALVIVAVLGGGIFGGVVLVGEALSRILGLIIVFIVPITIIVALKIVYELGYTK